MQEPTLARQTGPYVVASQPASQSQAGMTDSQKLQQRFQEHMDGASSGQEVPVPSEQVVHGPPTQPGAQQQQQQPGVQGQEPGPPLQQQLPSSSAYGLPMQQPPYPQAAGGGAYGPTGIMPHSFIPHGQVFQAYGNDQTMMRPQWLPERHGLMDQQQQDQMQRGPAMMMMGQQGAAMHPAGMMMSADPLMHQQQQQQQWLQQQQQLWMMQQQQAAGGMIGAMNPSGLGVLPAPPPIMEGATSPVGQFRAGGMEPMAFNGAYHQLSIDTSGLQPPGTPPLSARGQEAVYGPFYTKPIPPNVLSMTINKSDVFRVCQGRGQTFFLITPLVGSNVTLPPPLQKDDLLTNPVVRVHVLDPASGAYLPNLSAPGMVLDPEAQVGAPRSQSQSGGTPPGSQSGGLPPRLAGASCVGHLLAVYEQMSAHHSY